METNQKQQNGRDTSAMKKAETPIWELDITQTTGYKKAMDDVKSGRVYQAESVDDLFKRILGEKPYNEIRGINV